MNEMRMEREMTSKCKALDKRSDGSSVIESCQLPAAAVSLFSCAESATIISHRYSNERCE